MVTAMGVAAATGVMASATAKKQGQRTSINHQKGEILQLNQQLKCGTTTQHSENVLGTSEEQNIDLAKLIFIRVWYVYADPINWIQ